MKNARFSYLALFLFIHTPIKPMEDYDHRLAIFEKLAEAFEGGGITQAHKFDTPSPVIMQREVPNQHDEEQTSQVLAIINMLEELKIPEESKIPETSPSIPRKEPSTETLQPGDSSDEDYELPFGSPSHEPIQAPISDNFQSQMLENVPHEASCNNNDEKQKALNYTVRKIIEILLADGTKQQEIVGGRSLAEIISPTQKESLKLHYERMAEPEELVNLFLSLKSKLSLLPFDQRKESTEFEHCKFIYAALKKRFNREKARELLHGTADYESDEEKIIEELKPDGSDVYRLSKNMLTYGKPTIERAIVESEATINNLTNEQNSLIKRLEKLKQQKKETNFKLTQEVAHVRHARQALDIFEHDRQEHKSYLSRRKNGLSATIESSKESLTNISSDIEDAIIALNVGLEKELKEQKKASQDNLDGAKASLAKLEYNMKNFDSPSGYKLFGT